MGDAVDGTLSEADAAAVRAHCKGCARCRELFEDLLDIRQTAATLDRHEPSPLLRDVIRARVRSEVAAQHPPQRGLKGQSVLLALAASLVLLVGIASWLHFGQLGRTGLGTPDTSAQLANAASELQLAEQHYNNAIAALEQLTADKQAKLDPQVADAINQSLGSIDKAIGDSRAALKTQPDSIVAQTSLLEALRMKVALLQETVSLMAARS